MASAASGRPLASDTVVVGEIGLGGEVRGVSQLRARVHEAAALGFARCLVPRTDLTRWKGPDPELPLQGVATVAEALSEAVLTTRRYPSAEGCPTPLPRRATA